MCKTRNVVQEKSTLGKYALIMSRFKHLGQYLRTKRQRMGRGVYNTPIFRAVRTIDHSFPLTCMRSGKLRRSFCVCFVTRYRVISSPNCYSSEAIARNV